ncbi:MAG: hypothetical protein Phog2KO_49300 [Phototrophicaceae bacterium]
MLRELRKVNGIETVLVASDIAYKMLVAEGEQVRQFFSTPDSLLERATQLISEIKPDIIIASHSSNGVGIDEALVACATVPTFVFQDYWGEINLGLGVSATTYFVLDEDAKALTKARWGLDNTIVVGSPKHTMYQDIDIAELRESTRHRLGIDDNTTLIGFLGQSSTLKGYQKTGNEFIKSLRKIDDDILLLIREHPIYKDHDYNKRFIELIDAYEIPYVIKTDEGSIEQWLVACDIVTTMFSLSGFDHSYLSAYSEKALGYVVYLLTNKTIRQYLKDELQMEQLPITHHDIGFNAKTRTELDNLLQYNPARLQVYHQACKTLIHHNPHQLILEAIQRTYNQWKY